MESYDLKKLQAVELDILLEIDRICKKHHIRYFLCAGTLLGAVRHQGFIPWDDDIDLYMTLSEYKRFCKVSKEEMKEPYFLQNYRTDYTHRRFCKIRKSGTTFIEKGYERSDMHQGVWVDIFPLVGVKQDARWLQRTNRVIRFFDLILKKRMENIPSRERSAVSNLIHMIPLSLVRAAVTAAYYFLLKDFDVYEKCYALSGSRTITPQFDRTLFSDTTDVSFEGYVFPAPKDWDRYLTLTYGDYMTPPPPEKRNGGCHEIAIIDLEHDFRELRSF